MSIARSLGMFVDLTKYCSKACYARIALVVALASYCAYVS